MRGEVLNDTGLPYDTQLMRSKDIPSQEPIYFGGGPGGTFSFSANHPNQPKEPRNHPKHPKNTHEMQHHATKAYQCAQSDRYMSPNRPTDTMLQNA